MVKQDLKPYIPLALWRFMRSRSIIRTHKKCAKICEGLINDFYSSDDIQKPLAKKSFENDKIIWQYWAQGYDNLSPIIKKCLASVDEYAKDYVIVRLSDDNVENYLDVPKFVEEKKKKFSIAHYSDLLRMMLLSTYGGIWLDVTVFLSANIQDYLGENDFFMFQRDPEEHNKEYWRNTYAYYFGWNKGFRVNVLNSIIYARKESLVLTTLCGTLLYWWKFHSSIPDYFFFQILFDVLIHGKLAGYNCPIVSDCKPHYLQQSINDPKFSIMDRGTILSTIPIHKLTYKL